MSGGVDVGEGGRDKRSREIKRSRDQEIKRSREQESKRAREQESKRARDQESKKRSRDQEEIKRSRDRVSKSNRLGAKSSLKNQLSQGIFSYSLYKA